MTARLFSGKMRLYAIFIAGISLLIVFYLVQFGANYLNRPDHQFSKFQENFVKQQIELTEIGSAIETILQQTAANYWPLLERAVDESNIIAQIYHDDSLFFWNSRKITNEIARVNERIQDTVIFQKTGWYLMQRRHHEGFDIFILKQIKSEYAYNNSYLPNTFNPDFTSSSNIQLTHNLEQADHVILDKNGKRCLGLILTSDRKLSDGILMVLFGLFILFYLVIILLISHLYQMVKGLINNKIGLFIFFVADLIFLRFIDFFTAFPAVLKQSFLFEGSVWAIQGLTTPGDYILNALIVFAIAYKYFIFTREYQAEEKENNRLFKAVLSSIFLFALAWGLFYALYAALQTLDYNAFFGLTLLSKKGLVVASGMLLLIFALYLFSVSLIKNVNNVKYSLIILLSVLFLFALLTEYFVVGFPSISIASLTYVYGSLLISYYLPGRLKTQPLKLMLGIVLLSSTCTIVINQLKKDKKDNHQASTAQLLSDSSDLNFEAHYASVVAEMKRDTLINDIILNYLDPEQNLGSYLQGTYFHDFMDKYTIQVTVCEAGEQIIINPEGMVYDCQEYFSYKVADLGVPTETKGLFRIDDLPETVYYLAMMDLNELDREDNPWTLIIEFFYSYVPEGLGYTELLVDNSQTNLDLTRYSFAVYENGQLNNKFGNFPYYTRYDFLASYEDGVFFNMMDHRHLKIKSDDRTYLVVSRPLERPSERLAVFSTLFIVLLLIFFLYLFIYLFKGAETLLQLSFRNRLQMIFISTISLIIAILALITLFYAEADNEYKTVEQLNEKTASVLIELQHKLGGYQSLSQVDQEELQMLLEKFSSVFFSDINLYNTSGQLIATSRRDIFVKGLLSENINPMAFEELFVKNKLSYISMENIGSAVYYSSYVPLNLDGFNAAGIVNLPYFAKQSEVTRSYYLMLFTFINMFVILGIAGTLLALLLSRVLTRPLLLLQDSLRTIQIDRENERLEWTKDDEIGQLISEYNRMVEKLEQSAEMLKHSERESAWREVAQQIAHEIKNPLTPMKLNVQYLEKAYEADDPNLKDKIHSISATLISQIDSLNQVAEMFSNFAKTNAGNLENVDLGKVIGDTVSLFSNQPGLDLEVNIQENDHKFETLGVEKDLLRVFNNLIKNAIQSMEEVKDKKIEISMGQKDDFITVLISDTGKGILPEARPKIFQPYFTTKTTGTGLGLAIARNIMHEVGGEISFEERKGGGTTFILYFRPIT
jgi:signal transduction histidine kinase